MILSRTILHSVLCMISCFMFSTAISKSKLKPLQVSQQCDSPAFLSDDDDAGNEIPITNTIKTTYVHPIPKGSRDTPVLSVMTPIPSSAPLKKSVSRQTVLSSDSDGSFEECKFWQETRLSDSKEFNSLMIICL